MIRVLEFTPETVTFANSPFINGLRRVWIPATGEILQELLTTDEAERFVHTHNSECHDVAEVVRYEDLAESN